MDSDIASLVNSAKEGNSDAFGKLFELTNKKAYYTALKITENPRDAEDMVQEAYVKAFSSLNMLKDDTKFEKWLNRIVANNCRDLAKKRKPDLLSDYDKKESESSFEDLLQNTDFTLVPDEVTDKKAIRKLVMKCIEKLPEEQKVCVIMYYYNERSIAQIAKKLDIPQGTVKSRLNKARKTLKKQFEDIERKDNIKLHSLSVPVGVSAVFKKVVAGVGAAAIITGGSLAAREVIKHKSYEPVATTAIVSQISKNNTTAQKTKEKTTNKEEKNTSENKAVKSKAKKSSLLVITDEKDNTFYLDEYGVACREKNGEVFHVSFQKPRNLCFYGSLMYIYKGFLYKLVNNEAKKIMKVEGDYLYSVDNGLISISSDNNKAYLINTSKKKCSRFEKGSNDFKYTDNKLYFRSSDNKIKQAYVKKDGVNTKNVVSLENKDKLKLHYAAYNDKLYYTDFDSDITGIINIKNIRSGKVQAVRLNGGIKDFSVSENRIYFSLAKGGLYYYENNTIKKISDGNFYCSSASDGNMLWCSSIDDEAFLIKAGQNKLIPIENGSDILDFSVSNDTLLYWGENGYNYMTIS